MENYVIQDQGEGTRALDTMEFTGKVTVLLENGAETHELWVKEVRVAEYKRQEGDVQGETFSYIVGRRKIGNGNLLAGVLLRLGQLEKKRKSGS